MTVLAVVGRGRVGRTLARGWRDAGLEVRTLAGRATRRPRHVAVDACVLAVPDGHIEDVAASLSSRLRAGAVLFHCAGARGPEALGSVPGHVARGALHPMVSFADARRPPPLRGASFALSGEPRARRVGRRLVRALGAHPVEAAQGDLHGPAYHAAAALLANGAAALAAEARRVLLAEGVDASDADRMLAALLASVAANVASLGLPAALTGPVARGDAATVRAHRRALASESRATYDAVAGAILRLARDQGLGDEQAAAVARALRAR